MVYRLASWSSEEDSTEEEEEEWEGYYAYNNPTDAWDDIDAYHDEEEYCGVEHRPRSVTRTRLPICLEDRALQVHDDSDNNQQEGDEQENKRYPALGGHDDDKDGYVAEVEERKASEDEKVSAREAGEEDANGPRETPYDRNKKLSFKKSLSLLPTLQSEGSTFSNEDAVSLQRQRASSLVNLPTVNENCLEDEGAEGEEGEGQKGEEGEEVPVEMKPSPHQAQNTAAKQQDRNYDSAGDGDSVLSLDYMEKNTIVYTGCVKLRKTTTVTIAVGTPLITMVKHPPVVVEAIGTFRVYCRGGSEGIRRQAEENNTDIASQDEATPEVMLRLWMRDEASNNVVCDYWIDPWSTTLSRPQHIVHDRSWTWRHQTDKEISLTEEQQTGEPPPMKFHDTLFVVEFSHAQAASDFRALLETFRFEFVENGREPAATNGDQPASSDDSSLETMEEDCTVADSSPSSSPPPVLNQTDSKRARTRSYCADMEITPVTSPPPSGDTRFNVLGTNAPPSNSFDCKPQSFVGSSELQRAASRRHSRNQRRSKGSTSINDVIGTHAPQNVSDIEHMEEDCAASTNGHSFSTDSMETDSILLQTPPQTFSNSGFPSFGLGEKTIVTPSPPTVDSMEFDVIGATDPPTTNSFGCTPPVYSFDKFASLSSELQRAVRQRHSRLQRRSKGSSGNNDTPTKSHTAKNVVTSSLGGGMPRSPNVSHQTTDSTLPPPKTPYATNGFGTPSADTICSTLAPATSSELQRAVRQRQGRSQRKSKAAGSQKK